MENGNLNVIIFQDDEAPSIDHRQPRTHSSKSPSNYHQYDIIEQEIQYLAEKVKSLQEKTDNISLFRNDSNCMQRNSMTNIESGGVSKDVLIAIEKKIQIIVKETRKIVDKLGQNFQKKLEGKLTKKYDELGVTKIKQNYASSVKKIEEHYKKEIDKINKEYKEVQARMMAKMGQVEQRYLSRINEFALKQKEYVAWIHHLQIQLKQQQHGSKKMIELTQQKVSKRDVSEGSILSNNFENNYSSINQNQNHNPNLRISPLPNDNNNSKIQRKHRIFDNANNGSSVSPNNKLPQTNNTMNITNNQPASNSNSNLYQSTKVVNPAIRTKPLPSQHTQPSQPVTLSLATRNIEPIRNVFSNENESPWRNIDKESDKRAGQQSVRNRVIENVREEEFYKDVPKPNSGWEKFQDFKEIDDDQSSDSDEDVLFYRESDQQQEFMDGFRSTKFKGQQSKKEKFSNNQQQKVFSPFDLS